jgi:hypothetical protein
MGYEIKALSPKEIQQQVSNEKIVPSLFWLIPIGDDWHQSELEDVFFEFNSLNNRKRIKLLCNFFVKGDPNQEPSKRKKKALSLSDKSNEINKILAGLNIKFKKSLLITCSNFPHPGWGLLINVDQLKNILEQIETILSDQKFNKIAEVAKHTYASYLSLKQVNDSLELESTEDDMKYPQPNIFNAKQTETQQKHHKIYSEYVNTVNRLVEEVMKFSSDALIEIEKSKLFELEIIITDGPRMIGWKTAAAISGKLSAISFADYLNREYKSEIEIDDIDLDQKLDGDIFTDYLHHILINNTSKYGGTRKITEKILYYYNYDQRKEITDFFQLPDECKKDNNKLLTALGWNENLYDYFDTSLLSYFEKITEGKYFISNPKKETYSGLRESYESYLKDLVKIIKKHITSNEEKIDSLIKTKYPNFKKPAKLTSTPLCWMIHALGPVWKIEVSWDDFYKITSEIANILNEDGRVHHNEQIKREDEVVRILNPLFDKLFKFTKEIFKAMPLHFRPSSNFMSNLFTGIAWAHDIKDKKEVRVLIWDTENEIELGKEILIWNPSKINPVITNFKKL